MKRTIKILVCLILCFCFFVNTSEVAAIKPGTTLKDLKNDLAKLQNEKAIGERKKQSTQSQIKQNQSNVNSANNGINAAKNKITNVTNEIAKNKEKIKGMQKEADQLLVLYQKLSTENSYVKYATGSNTMSELIMRIDAIKQLTEYNNKKLNELDQLVISNKKMEKQLASYQKTLSNRVVQYESNISNLGVELKDLVEEYEDYDSQIKGVKESINMYVRAGCKDTDDLNVCFSVGNNSGWLRPFSRGKITSGWGYRIHPVHGTYKFHNGIDISDSGIAGRPIYATASGVVGKITRRASCGGNMVYIWVYVNGKPYTATYMHLRAVNVNVGDKVTTATVIGTVGGDSSTPWDTCTTGAHLHYGVSGGHYPTRSADGYTSYATYIARSINPPGFPGKGAWFRSR